MTDLEITRLCAEAMEWGYELDEHGGYYDSEGSSRSYWPLFDDAQAMALVKKLELGVSPMAAKVLGWEAICWKENKAEHRVVHESLNRAICECVANMQSATVDRSAKP